jgi:hypothetical protein
LSDTGTTDQPKDPYALDDVPPMPGAAASQQDPTLPRAISPTPEEYAILEAEGLGYLTPLPGQNRYAYTGPSLTDKNGRIQRKQYDEVAESLVELSKLGADERVALQRELAQRGFYPKNMRPSQNGFEPHDLLAMSELLATSNYYGYTWNDALPVIRSQFASRGSGRVARSAKQIKKSLDDQAVEALGRRFTQAEVQGLIAQIRQREAKGDTSTLAEMAQETVASANPDEVKAYRFVQAANILNEMLRTG